jgi:hypothetical protein
MSDDIQKALADPELHKRLLALLVAPRSPIARPYDLPCAEPVPQWLVDIVMAEPKQPRGRN